MRKSLYIFSLVCCIVMLCLQSIALAASDTATINKLRISNNKDKVRIVVDANKEVDYQSFALSSPDRIVVDLNDATLSKSVQHELDIDSKFASKVRVAQFKENVVRVVVETKVKKSGYDIFGIVGGETPYRVAMDFGNVAYSAVNDISSSDKDNKNDDNNDYTLNKDFSISKDAKSVLKGKKITLDPGHGGNDSGAVGPAGTYEKVPTLRIGLNVAEMLKQSGAKVYITRNEIASMGAIIGAALTGKKVMTATSGPGFS